MSSPRPGPGGRWLPLTFAALLALGPGAVSLGRGQSPAPAIPFPTVPASPQSPTADEQALRGLLRRAADALVARDGDALETLLAEDYTFGTPVGQVLSRTQRIAAVRSGQRPVRSLDYDDVSVRVYGNAAVLTAHYVEHAPDGHQSGGRLLNVYVRAAADAAWRLVASQNGFDAPPAAAPSGPR